MTDSKHAEKDASDNDNPAPNSKESANPEPTIDQVRDLLFGGAQRSIEQTLAELRSEMEASHRELRAEFERELEVLQTRIRELEKETEQKRLASQREIGEAISELGATISARGSERSGK